MLDFNAQQEQAIQYAKEMHSKSTNNNRQNPNAFIDSFFPVKNIMQTQSNRKNNDNDITLILALILLLSQDGGDRMLMMALLYIMT